MGLYAQIENGIVVSVIVATPDEIQSGRHGDPASFVETFEDGSQRGCYAGIGYTYVLENDIFIPPSAGE